MSEPKDATASSAASTASTSESKEEKNSTNSVSIASIRPQTSSSSASSSSSSSQNGRLFPRSSSPCSSRTFGRVFARNGKFEPNEDLVKQIMDMGICRNGAVKALYWTGNQSALAASNWIFDQPDRDLDTPLEDELEMIRAQQAEREREELEESEFASHMCRGHHHHHHHHHLLHHSEDFDEDDIDEDDLMEEEEEEDEDEEDEDIEDDEDEDMEYKMVFVVNRAAELESGMMSLYVAKATSALFRKINAQPQSVLVGPDELSMWGDLGEKMIVLFGENEQHMKDLELMAKNLRLPCHMIDLIQEGTRKKAVLGIFGEEREVNKVTGRLKVVK